jgi:FtsP/CotA-like multicopper oxidase with cupredoxin domain
MKFPAGSLVNTASALILLALLIHTSAMASPCPGANVVTDPEEFQWTYHPATANNPEPYYSGVMEVGEATFTIGGETLTTRAYRQAGGSYSIPGPTMRVAPGNKYVLSFHNLLPYEAPSPDKNVFKDPNISNLHTHGLHISGESPGDDVTRSFEGGFGGDFVYDIPADHMGGTYWYHAHHHGSTFLQVSGGMFGLLIVDDANDGIPDPVAAMEERQIILGFLDPAAAGAGGDTLMSGTLSPTWTVNGLVEGNICMPPDTWQHWRVLLADRDARAKTIEFGPECEVMVLARDGVWRTVAPKDLTTNGLSITGASRADFAVRTTGDSWLAVDGTVVANIYADGSVDPLPHPFDDDGVSTWSALRPDYLRDLRGETDVNFESVSMGARTINGSKFDMYVPTFSIPATQVQEWSVSGAVNHPFHLHVYHVQALADDKDFEAGEYYDVIASKMSVRFDLNQLTTSPYDGRTILHCHILGHEDRGAMGWMDVIGGAGPPTFPADDDLAVPFSEYYSLAGGPQVPAPPSNAVATATSSSAIALSWDDNASDEEGFDIERSTDGATFSPLVSVGANVVSYTDTGLSPATTYYYRLTAYNVSGSSGSSNVAEATTFPDGGGATIHVENIVVSRQSVGKNRTGPVAVVTVFDDGGAPVAGATVSGEFTGPTSSGESGTTDANGEVSLTGRSTRNPDGEWCFAVTGVVLDGATYDPGANLVTQACESGPAGQSQIAWRKSTSQFKLVGGFPNPFRNSTQIAFNLPETARVVLEAYTVRGRRVEVIANQNFGPGQHLIAWNPEGLAQGVYMLRLRAGSMVDTRRVVLMR